MNRESLLKMKEWLVFELGENVDRIFTEKDEKIIIRLLDFWLENNK